MSVKGGGGVPPKSVTFFLAKILSVKGGGTPLTDKIRKVVFEVLPKVQNVSQLCLYAPIQFLMYLDGRSAMVDWWMHTWTEICVV